jgi:hypothetical protein
VGSRCLTGVVVLLAALSALVAAVRPAGAEDFFNLVKSCSVRTDDKACQEAKVFVNQEKTILLACLPGDYVYKIYRKEKRVSAVRRPSVLVMGDKCRPIDGAAELPIEGHRLVEKPPALSFNDLGGRKVVLSLPPGAVR